MTSYSGIHAHLSRTRGRAVEHVCACGARAAEWAYTHDDPCPNERVDPRGKRFSVDVARYVPMCLRCHRLYDKSAITRCPQGHEYTEENTLMDAGKRKCKTCVYARNRKRKPTPEQQARRIELQRIRRAAAKEVVA